MSTGPLFCTLSSEAMAAIVRGAQRFICFAGPGLHVSVAEAMLEATSRIGPEMITVHLDFDERVMRMGYGSIEAVATLRGVGIDVRSARGMRTGLLIADDVGFVFTPTPLYLEAEPGPDVSAPNALRIYGDQIQEALVRLSPSARAIAVAQAPSAEDKRWIEALPADVRSAPVSDRQFAEVSAGLKEAPPVPFDLARQVRVFEPYLQYVELHLTGAAIQKHKLAIPPIILALGGGKDLEGRLRTTFDLIEKGSKLSSKPLEDALNEIRKNLTPSLGKDHGRVVLKNRKPLLMKRLDEFRVKLKAHQEAVEAGLQKQLDESREQIVDYYVARALESPPDALLGQTLSAELSKEDAARWLRHELDRVFPAAKALIQEMKLEERYKDVTFETLDRPDFLESVKEAFPWVDWERAYREFLAAAESGEMKQRHGA